jgi:hypothetical protein
VKYSNSFKFLFKELNQANFHLSIWLTKINFKKGIQNSALLSLPNYMLAFMLDLPTSPIPDSIIFIFLAICKFFEVVRGMGTREKRVAD